MIRRHPEALAIALILLFVTVGGGFRSLHDRVFLRMNPIHREMRIERDNFRVEGQRILSERDRIRREIRDDIRNAFHFNCN